MRCAYSRCCRCRSRRSSWSASGGLATRGATSPRRSDAPTSSAHPELASLSGLSFPQMNESRSRPGTVRGLHFQWNPFMGKLVRTLTGRMVDIVLDIRKGSPTLGRALLVDMPYDDDCRRQRVDLGAARFRSRQLLHDSRRGSSTCARGEWSPACEAGISPLAPRHRLVAGRRRSEVRAGRHPRRRAVHHRQGSGRFQPVGLARRRTLRQLRVRPRSDRCGPTAAARAATRRPTNGPTTDPRCARVVLLDHDGLVRSAPDTAGTPALPIPRPGSSTRSTPTTGPGSRIRSAGSRGSTHPRTGPGSRRRTG